MAADGTAIVAFLQRRGGAVSFNEFLREFKLGPGDRSRLRGVLDELVHERRLHRAGGKHWTLPRRDRSALTGVLSVTRRGFGFVRPEGRVPGDTARDVYVGERDMRDALDGDTVLVRIVREDDEGPAGRVEEVLERAHETITGWYQRATQRQGTVTPRNPKLGRQIVVAPPDAALGVKDHDWVVAEVTEWTSPPNPLVGKVRERLGADADRGIDVLLLLRDRGIVPEFPPQVEREAAKLAVDADAELKHRKDHRKLPTVTIDPVTAKDFDDALSIEPAPGGGWRLWVHIADVTHFIARGGHIDVEAQERSTSVYPCDRVVPMLPERLSNDLCSLRPGVDRLTVTAEMKISLKGELTGGKFHASIIHSRHRMTYEEVQALIDDSDATVAGKYADVRELVGHLRDCARALRKARFGRGALDLDIPEVKILFDAAGKVDSLAFAPHFEAHELVEECMLIANEAVAQRLTRAEAPLLYRVHEPADSDRLLKLVPVLKAFGVRLDVGKGGEGLNQKGLQAALREAEKLPAGHLVRRLILRALKRAEYSPKNPGHFGLASKCYCHFTSPIRRYPDVVVHRQLKALEAKEDLAYPADGDGRAELAELGRHASRQEREAQDAEWEAVHVKSLEFMQRHVGEEFDGFVSSVQSWGFFVELEPYPVDGIVALSGLKDDRYDVDESGIKLVGRKHGKVYKVGQRVRVRVAKIRQLEGEMDLILAGGAAPAPRRYPKAGKRR